MSEFRIDETGTYRKDDTGWAFYRDATLMRWCDEFESLMLDTIVAVTAERDAARVNEARYLWLRDDGETPKGMREIVVYAERLPFTEDSDEMLEGEALDAAIDAARERAGK